ncbi:hypothetical protein I9W82_000039 [Candida metapsilosis]|uniref:DUF3020 domain-containing protein n=1 Tax=Candida metapsilosis TaxID=273372 RepID=A0A8H8DCM5_9ASCO|nr:hypothetical protein I9W82_000039 [Candida metapsilosis]
MSKNNGHTNHTPETNNLRRNSDDLESSIGAIFENIDFSSMPREVDDQEEKDETADKRIPNEQSLHNHASYEEDDMKDAIANALNDVFDLKDKSIGQGTDNEIQTHEGGRDREVQSTSSEGMLLDGGTGEASISKSQDLDDAIDSAFDTLLKDSSNQGEEPRRMAAPEKTNLLQNHSMQTGLLSQTEEYNVEEASRKERKDIDHEMPARSQSREDQERAQLQQEDSNAFSEVGAFNKDDADGDELDLAIQNALGNIFDKQEDLSQPNKQDQGKSNVAVDNDSAMIKNKGKSKLNSENRLHDRGATQAPSTMTVEKESSSKSNVLSQFENDPSTFSDENLDENLKGIIGQALDDIFGKESSGNDYKDLQHAVEGKTQSKSISDRKQPRNDNEVESVQKLAIGQERTPLANLGPLSAPSSNSPNNEQDEDQYLVDAIGAAFRSIEESNALDRGNETHSGVMQSKGDSHFENQSIQGHHVPHGRTKLTSTATDQDIEDAIAAAFKSAMSAADANNNEVGADGVIRRVQPKLRKKSVRKLADEITQQVHNHFKDESGGKERLLSIAGAPIVNHTPATQVHQGEHNLAQDLDKKIHTAVKTAVKSVAGTEKDDEIVDIEQLQMNEILENAIRMASEIPQELISDLEIDQIVGVREAKKPSIPDKLNKTNLTALGNKGKQRKPAKDQLRVPPSLDDKAKLKSISTEPQRSNNNNNNNKNQFDFPSRLASKEDTAKNSLLSNPDIKSQISTVMSSLTSRINSGELADTNILFTIRQITEELASGGSLANFLSNQASSDNDVSVNEDADRKALANAFGMARHFLLDYSSHVPAEEMSIDEINTMITNLNEDFSSSNLTLSTERAEFISAIANSVLTSLVDEITNIQYSAEVYDEVEKFKNSSPEARRRTRVGNRERKKKWREENAERNRDIELRTRVLKKASTEFGEEDTPIKLEWIESEFKRRKARRYARSQADDDKSEESSKAENNKSQDVKEKVDHVVQGKQFNNQVKDVMKIFFDRPDHSRKSSHLITVSIVLGALALIHSEADKLDEEIMLSGMKSILKTITSRPHMLENHRTRLSPTASRRESSKRRLSEILLNAKRLKVDTSIVAPIRDPQPLHASDVIVSKPSLQLPRNSPFISHKIGANVNTSAIGLRKPGTFQKPKPFENPRKDKSERGSLDSPKLYSTS